MYSMQLLRTHVLIGLCLAGWSWLCATGCQAQTVRSPYKKLDTFAHALSHIEQAYVSPVDEDTLIYGAITGMLKALDPHSTFLDPQAYRILTSDTEGRYAGVGVEVDVRDGWLTVLTVFEGGPAAQAGIKAGDRFLSIDGHVARDMPIDEAIERMRGEPGTMVVVKVRREGEENAIEAELRRASIEVPSVAGKLLRDGTVMVRLRMFQEGTADHLRAVLQEMDTRLAGKGEMRGLLLDLRDNPGGLVSSAVLVVDQFLSRGVIVSTRGRGDRLLSTQKAHESGTRAAMPIVVLVNGYSASASEIVAGALQDHGRAVVVGEKTFGKGSVQSVVELPDGSAMKLTTALYFTPSGRSIQAMGIVPDVHVPQLSSEAAAAFELGRDDIREATLEGHLNVNQNMHAKRNAELDAFANDFQGKMAHQILQALVANQRRGASTVK